MGIATLFVSSLLLCRSRIPKKHQFFQFEISLPQTSKRKQTDFANSKIKRKTLKEKGAGTAGTQVFESKIEEITTAKYGDLTGHF